MKTPPAPVNDDTAQDKHIRDVAAIIADYVSPEGHDPEEWGQLCELAEKILRSLKLWNVREAKPVTKGEGK